MICSNEYSLQGPEVVGNPFWCLMEWENNQLTGNLFAVTPGLCLFLRKEDAERHRLDIPVSYRWVVRGIDRNFLYQIIRQYDRCQKLLPPLILILPSPGGKKAVGLKVKTDDIRYYVNNGRLKNKNLQTALEKAFEITKNPPSDMYERKLVLDPFFEYLKQIYLKFPRPYSKLPKLLSEYRKQLWMDAEQIKDEVEPLLTMKNQGQCYSRIFDIPQTHYEMVWSIPSAEVVVQKYNLPRKTFMLNKLMPLVDQSNITYRHLKNVVHSEEPILVIHYPVAVPNRCIIDGNHRVIAKYQDGQRTIQGYLLEPEHHLEAMMLNAHRTIFKIHYNINEIVKYMTGVKEMSELKLLQLK